MTDHEFSRRIGFALICTLVVLSGLWLVAAGKRRVTVTIRVDAETRQVATAASTVGELLVHERVSVLPSDVVQPPVTASVLHGLTVEVRRGRSVTLVTDGHAVARTTVGGTVEEALRLEGIELPEGAIVRPSPETPVVDAMEVSIRRPSVVTLRHDDVQQVVVTTAATVRELLAERGVAWGADDVVEPGLQIVPVHRLVVTVHRGGTHEHRTSERVPPPLEVHEDPGVALGDEVVLDSGKEGRIDRLYRTVVADGALKGRVLVNETAVDPPRPRVTVRGTKPPAAFAPPTAAPEPVAPPAAGPPEPTVATAPEPLPSPPEPPGRRTEEGAASYYLRAGQAAAHPTLPLGTEVKVINLETGASIHLVVDDRGPYVGGRIIDLSEAAFHAIAPLDAGVISVRVEW